MSESRVRLAISFKSSSATDPRTSRLGRRLALKGHAASSSGGGGARSLDTAVPASLSNPGLGAPDADQRGRGGAARAAALEGRLDSERAPERLAEAYAAPLVTASSSR